MHCGESARRHQATEEFRKSYASRAGIERNACAGDSSLRLAQMPLHRVGKDTFTTRHYSRCGQPGQSR